MTMARKIVMYAFLVTLAVVFIYGTMKFNTEVAGVGDQAPEFTLEDMDGDLIRLSDYKGKFVILNFFASWCPPCREEAPDLQAFEEEYGDQVKLLILDRAEPKQSVQKFIDEFNATSTFLLDKNDSMAKPYGVTGQPETFFIDEKGVIRFHQIGPMTKSFMVETVNKFRQKPLTPTETEEK